MKLEVGARDLRRGDDWVALDVDDACLPHVVGDARWLPFADERFDELIAADVLEHVLPWQVEPTLREWRRVLVRHGLLRLRVPNMQQLGRLLHSGIEIATTMRNIYGGHRFGPNGSWDTHHVGWTPATLQADLIACGFEILTNDRALNMTIEAFRR